MLEGTAVHPNYPYSLHNKTEEGYGSPIGICFKNLGTKAGLAPPKHNRI